MHGAEMAHSLRREVEAGRARGDRFLRLVQASLLGRRAGAGLRRRWSCDLEAR
jgi:hypothetical protein